MKADSSLVVKCSKENIACVNRHLCTTFVQYNHDYGIKFSRL